MPIDHLPPRLQSPVERVRDAFMADAGVMVILGITMIVRGISYHDLGTFILVHPFDTHLPIWATSGWWIGLGAILVIAARWHCSRIARVVLSTSVATLALWGSLFIFSPPAAFSQRGVVYLALAAVIVWAVWRGRRGEIRLIEEPPHG